MVKTSQVFGLSVLMAAIALSACQPKKTDHKDQQTEQSANKAAVTQPEQPVLDAQQQKVLVELPKCNGNTCPQFEVKRLSSNYAVVDATMDQAILTYLDQILEVSETQQASTAAPTPTAESQAATPTATAELGNTAAQTAENQQQTFVAKVQPYADAFLALDQEIKTLSANQQINLSVIPKVLQSQGPLATVVLNTSSFLGGAHGSASQQYYNFDLKQKKQLHLQDILKANQQPALEKKMHTAFQSWVNENKLADNIAEYEQIWKFKLTDNFFLGKQGLILQYGEYEIGPYVVGLPRLVVPYSELQDILKPEYLPPEVSAAPAPSAPKADS